MRCCHSSVLSSYVMLAITSGAGHFHSGRLRMAKVGTRKANVPPWIMGNLCDCFQPTVRKFLAILLIPNADSALQQRYNARHEDDGRDDGASGRVAFLHAKSGRQNERHRDRPAEHHQVMLRHAGKMGKVSAVSLSSSCRERFSGQTIQFEKRQAGSGSVDATHKSDVPLFGSVRVYETRLIGT